MWQVTRFVLVVGALALVATGPAWGEELAGKITKIDASSFTIENDGKAAAFQLKPDIKVWLDKTQIRFNELKEGDVVEVDFSTENQKNIAGKVTKRLASPMLGVLKKFGDDDNSFVVQNGDQEFMFLLTPDTKVEVNRTKVPLKNLKPGVIISIKYEKKDNKNYVSTVTKM